jgi:hypothetical protein
MVATPNAPKLSDCGGTVEVAVYGTNGGRFMGEEAVYGTNGGRPTGEP